MSATRPFSSEFISCESNMPRLNVPAMIDPILENYNSHANQFILFLAKHLQSHLTYEGPVPVRRHILEKTTYACSVYHAPRKKILKDTFPVMIGSRLDFAIRHRGLRSFRDPLNDSEQPPFQEVDIARGFFLVNGFVRHVPYFYTNNSTNTHVVPDKKVRVFSYSALDRGKQLSYFLTDCREKNRKRRFGQVVVNHNDGTETPDDPHFFCHCPHPVDLSAYMIHLHRRNDFDIDHLGNKIFISPGHLFTKLFVKYLYAPLLDPNCNWNAIKSKVKVVTDSIKSGNLLHVLSRKTSFHKEAASPGKMTKDPPQESHREIGANGEVFVEKTTGCYREVSTQTYPLNPFLLYVVVRQMSSKVTNSKLEPYHPSHEGWFCKLGVFDTKNVGRTNTMVRSAVVSSRYDLEPVHQNQAEFWRILNLEPQAGSRWFVVVNEACVPVTRRCFDSLPLLALKRTFTHVECFARDNFIVIRLKVGMIMKRLPETDLYVTPYDEMFWARLCFQIEDKAQLIERFYGPDQYSYFADLNPFFRHNSFQKNILGLNNLKNAVLATTRKYAVYFADTATTYRHEPSDSHRALMEPVRDGVSEHFVLYLPHVTVAYMSFAGVTQEDCIAKRRDFRGFDCFRFYTLRFTLARVTSWVKFYPVHGDVDPDSDLLGTIVGGEPFGVDPHSMHVKVVPASDREYRLHFGKYPFGILQHSVVEGGGGKDERVLLISLEQEHANGTGDKLCSLHGQKGVVREMERLPLLDGRVTPDIVVNVYCVFRITLGQFLEALARGGGRDAETVHNSDGVLMPGAKAFYGRVFYVPVVYFGFEHLYAPVFWILDKVFGTPVKGRSRHGGMKLGNMEMNALRGNGLAAIFELKCFEDGDRVPVEGRPTETQPQSLKLVVHDMAAFKCEFVSVSTPAITLEDPNGVLPPVLVFSNDPRLRGYFF